MGGGASIQTEENDMSIYEQEILNDEPRPLCVIAAQIRDDWKKPYFGAVPYLDALASLEHVDEYYGDDPARSIVNYFLANASAWRGETARRVKAELKALVKGVRS